jgi:hypothetical protein
VIAVAVATKAPEFLKKGLGFFPGPFFRAVGTRGCSRACHSYFVRLRTLQKRY